MSLARHQNEARMLLEYLIQNGVDADDEQAITDALEGETDALDAVSRTLRYIAEQQGYSAGLTVILTQFEDRRSRYEARIKGARVALASFMEASGLTTLERPEATVGLRKGAKSVIKTADFNADALPKSMQRIKVEANIPAIKAALEAGETVPGATLSNAAPILTIRS